MQKNRPERDLMSLRSERSDPPEGGVYGEFIDLEVNFLKRQASLGEYMVSFKYGSVLVRVETTGISMENILYFALGRLRHTRGTLDSTNPMAEVRGIKYRPLKKAITKSRKA